MANLKDTIVLGNLTVTGKVTASELAGSSSNSNRFETIYANKIVGQSGGNYTLEIEALAENNQMKINTGYLDLFGTLRTSTITNTGGTESIALAGDGLTLNSTSDVTIISDYENGSGTVHMHSDDIKLYTVSDSIITLGRASGGFFKFQSGGSISIGDNVGGGISLYPEGSDYNLGTDSKQWNYGYFKDINASTKVYTPSIQNSGGISLSCGGSITLSATSAGGGYIDLNAKYSIRPNVNIIPSVTTADLGSTSTPFNNVYGKNFYASSDARLKENIVKSYFDYYNIINNIQLVNYTWKSDEQHILHHGLIAQQLKEILPEELHNHLISESTEDEKMMSVNDGKLVYFALGALQQQLHINNELEQRIQKLEKLIRGGQ